MLSHTHGDLPGQTRNLQTVERWHSQYRREGLSVCSYCDAGVENIHGGKKRPPKAFQAKYYKYCLECHTKTTKCVSTFSPREMSFD